MSDPNSDLFLSEGTCYFGEGEVSDGHFIPCGNSLVAGTQACCYAGDFCLAESTCYDNDTAVTYITGCTDATYSDSKCPHKPGYLTQMWVALARCDGDDIDLFSGCAHHGDEVEIEHEDCTCTAASALISNPVKGAPTLAQIGLLPSASGGTITFNPTSLPTGTSSSSSSSSSHKGLTSGAKIGIGVGLGVGIPLLLALVFALLVFQRKKKKRAAEREKQAGTNAPEVHQPGDPPSELPHQQSEGASSHQSPGPPLYSLTSEHSNSGWRHKPELHANETHINELPSNGTAVADGRHQMNSIQNTPFEVYPPVSESLGHHGVDIEDEKK